MFRVSAGSGDMPRLVWHVVQSIRQKVSIADAKVLRVYCGRTKMCMVEDILCSGHPVLLMEGLLSSLAL